MILMVEPNVPPPGSLDNTHHVYEMSLNVNVSYAGYRGRLPDPTETDVFAMVRSNAVFMETLKALGPPRNEPMCIRAELILAESIADEILAIIKGRST